MVKSGSILAFYHFGKWLFLVYYHPFLGCDVPFLFLVKVFFKENYEEFFGDSKVRKLEIPWKVLLDELSIYIPPGKRKS